MQLDLILTLKWPLNQICKSEKFSENKKTIGINEARTVFLFSSVLS